MPPRDPGAWMWAEAIDMLDRAERLHRQFFQVRQEQGGGACWEPPVDIFETDDALWIQVALLGVAPEQVHIIVEDGVLSVTGERRWPSETRGAMLHRLEIPHGRFERRIQLPAGGYELERRDLVNGLLTLSLRKLR